jgi:phytoene synthase
MHDSYLNNKVAEVGSPLYYSVRKLSLLVRETVIAIMAFYKEIEDITLNYTDLSVAQAKLNWWRNEVIKIQDGKPDHPVALELQRCLPSFSISPLRLIDIIDGLEQNLAFLSFEKFEDVVVHVMRTAGQRELLIADILLKGEKLDVEIIYQLALVVELTHYIQHLRRYVGRGLIYFSQEELLAYRVSEEQLQASVTAEAIRQLLEFQVEKIERSYQKALVSLSPKARLSLANLVVRCEMARANLKAIKTSHFCVLENFICITPIRSWWIAFIN